MKRIPNWLLGVAVAITGVVHASEQAHWSYAGETGPAHWGELSKDYVACAAGKNQSPIDLTNMVEANMEPISFIYRKVPLRVVNNGHTVQVDYPTGSQMFFTGHTYRLLQFHFHSPSEHHIQGKAYPLEAHLVHADNEGNLAVIAVMFTEGDDHPTIASVWTHMPMKAGEKAAPAGLMVKVADLFPANLEYYRYNGSLTTPPCTEGVRWMVLKRPVAVSTDQARRFRSLMHHDNNRPLQPVNNRPVLK